MLKHLASHPLVSQVRGALERLSPIPPLLARLCVGWVFVESGWGKLHNLAKVTEFFESLKLPAPAFQARLVASTEFGCGLLLMVGLLTRLVAIPLTVIMGVALLTAKAEDIKVWTDLFAIYEFLYILFFVWLIVEGPGCLSLDRLFFWPAKKGVAAP
jgi:putative oxidoreductase